MDGELLPLLTDSLTEPALDSSTAGGVAQLTGYSTAVALDIVELTDASIQ